VLVGVLGGLVAAIVALLAASRVQMIETQRSRRHVDPVAVEGDER
jgi:hypothetical protein